jgi:5-methylcytosine-specific restriction endonuclease McrA
MPDGRIQRWRDRAFKVQQGLCYYCDEPMNPRTDRQDDPKMVTAEHLVPKKNGGRNVASNIVAACRYCNNVRHNPGKKKIEKRHHK